MDLQLTIMWLFHMLLLIKDGLIDQCYKVPTFYSSSADVHLHRILHFCYYCMCRLSHPGNSVQHLATYKQTRNYNCHHFQEAALL